MWAEKVHSTPATVKPARIEDAGEKLWGARKDDEHLSNSVAAEVDWLDQLWPKLQYNNLDGDNDDKYLNGAIEMDQKEGDRRHYWASNEELFARSFEAYVYDTLTTNSEKNEYLVSGVDQASHENRLRCGNPLIYPIRAQRLEMNRRMQELVNSCRTAWTKTPADEQTLPIIATNGQPCQSDRSSTAAICGTM